MKMRMMTKGCPRCFFLVFVGVATLWQINFLRNVENDITTKLGSVQEQKTLLDHSFLGDSTGNNNSHQRLTRYDDGDDGDNDRGTIRVSIDEETSKSATMNTKKTANLGSEVQLPAIKTISTTRVPPRLTPHVPPKAFLPWQERFGPNTPLPCWINHRPAHWNPFNARIQKQPTKEGLLFVKIDKAASSTLSGVASRMAVKLGERLHKNYTYVEDDKKKNNHQQHQTTTTLQYPQPVCNTRMSHIWSQRIPQIFAPEGHRNRTQSFLWTFFREPAKRAVSEYFYYFVDLAESQRTKPCPTDDWHVLSYLMKNCGAHLGRLLPQQKNTLLWKEHTTSPQHAIHAWIQGKGPTMNVTAVMETPAYKEYAQQVQKLVQSTLDQMDFVGTVERMDESLVILKTMLHLETDDILTTDAKNSGGYLLTKVSTGYECVLVPKHPLSSTVKAFIASDEWKYVWNLVDYTMYQAIEDSLDHTIHQYSSLSHTHFQRDLAHYQHRMQHSVDYCSPPNITLKCDEHGNQPPNHSPCYWNDANCGFACLDAMPKIGLSNM